MVVWELATERIRALVDGELAAEVGAGHPCDSSLVVAVVAIVNMVLLCEEERAWRAQVALRREERHGGGWREVGELLHCLKQMILMQGVIVAIHVFELLRVMLTQDR